MKNEGEGDRIANDGNLDKILQDENLGEKLEKSFRNDGGVKNPTMTVRDPEISAGAQFHSSRTGVPQFGSGRPKLRDYVDESDPATHPGPLKVTKLSEAESGN